MNFQQLRAEDWLRVQRGLLAAERRFSQLLLLFADGMVSRHELDEAKHLLESHRALADAVTSRVMATPVAAAEVPEADSRSA